MQFFLSKNIRFLLLTIIIGVVGFLFSDSLFRKKLSTFFPPKPEPSIIFIAIDGLRADHLGCYGYSRNISPNIDRFAKESVVFKNNFSQSPYSLSSHISMFTSQYPLAHGVIQGQETDLSTFNKYRTLSEILGKKGFTTSIFAQGGYYALKPLFSRGFTRIRKVKELRPFFKKIHSWFLEKIGEKKFIFIYSSILNPPYLYQKDVQNIYRDRSFLLEETEKAKDIIAKGLSKEDVDRLSDREKSRLLFYALLEKCNPKDIFHRPLWRMAPKNWESSDDYNRQISSLIDSYDANIMIIDGYLGRLFDLLKASGAWDDALIIITSSHGQEFYEHKYIGSSFNLYDTLLNTPLLIKLPKSEAAIAGEIDQFSETVDIMPTIFDIFEIDYKGRIQGMSLLPFIKRNFKKEKQVVFGFYRDKRSVRTKNYKYITCNKRICKRSELFNLLADPHEKKNLINSNEPPLRGIDCLINKHIRSSHAKKNK